jgi:glutaconate CoA-transferase, subunit B
MSSTTTSTTEYGPKELLICLAARQMEDQTTAFIGTGIPMLAASLAQKLQAPGLITIFEFGGTGAILDQLPLAVGDMRTYNRALHASGICDIMESAQRGFVEFGFLGGAQIDCYGNLNSTVIGDIKTPKVRLPGSGGGCDVGSLCSKTISIMIHDRRHFVDKLDFITTPGYLQGGESRRDSGLPSETGPYRVVTNLGVMGFQPESKRMELLAINPGATIEQIKESTGFEMLISENLEESAPPTAKELDLLRNTIDPDGLYR